MASSSKFVNVDDEYDGAAASKRKKPRTQDEYVRAEVDDEDAPCTLCVTHIKPHLLLYYNDRLYVSVPDRTPLIDRQLLIRPVSHANSLVSASEDVINDVNQSRKVIGAMFDRLDQEVIFVESFFKSQRWKRHFEIVCFPVPKKHAANLRMSFKKSILECEHEWSINKKLVSIDRQVTRCVSFFIQINRLIENYSSFFSFNPTASQTTFLLLGSIRSRTRRLCARDRKRRRLFDHFWRGNHCRYVEYRPEAMETTFDRRFGPAG